MTQKKQTAVEWLIDQIPLIDKNDPYDIKILNQALEMEREQIEKAYASGKTDVTLFRSKRKSEYYNETYGKEDKE